MLSWLVISQPALLGGKKLVDRLKRMGASAQAIDKMSI
jgi:hypothetical protein